ncbi:conserved hypothetical protein, partial [Ricinus communis]
QERRGTLPVLRHRQRPADGGCRLRLPGQLADAGRGGGGQHDRRGQRLAGDHGQLPAAAQRAAGPARDARRDGRRRACQRAGHDRRAGPAVERGVRQDRPARRASEHPDHAGLEPRLGEPGEPAERPGHRPDRLRRGLDPPEQLHAGAAGDAEGLRQGQPAEPVRRALIAAASPASAPLPRPTERHRRPPLPNDLLRDAFPRCCPPPPARPPRRPRPMRWPRRRSAGC